VGCERDMWAINEGGAAGDSALLQSRPAESDVPFKRIRPGGSNSIELYGSWRKLQDKSLRLRNEPKWM
jgi:hypothetical protein